jgi:hypothetical protein
VKHKLHYPLRAWAVVTRPGAVQHLPPFCYVGAQEDADGLIVTPDVADVLQAVQDGDIPSVDNCDPRYRGLAVSISDHGNVTLLYRFRNGNTREVWGVV